MLRHGLILAAATAVAMGGALILGTGVALASGSSADCTAAGGTYVKDGPNSTCVFDTSKDVNGNAFGTETTTTTTGQGNTGNKTETTCTGNPGHCK